jgi:hypothetical protein
MTDFNSIELTMIPEEYDALVHCGTPDMGDLRIALKLDRKDGPILVGIGFTAVIDGDEVRVQTVTTARLMMTILAAIKGFAAKHKVAL